MNAVLDFPILDDAALPPAPPPEVSQRATLATIDLQAVALARFGDWKPQAQALVERYREVVFDPSTTKGAKELAAAIADVRAPRYAAQNVSKASKAELAKVSKAIGAEEAEIIKFLEPTESRLVKIRDDHEAEALRKKQEAQRAEDERKEKLAAGVARIYGYIRQATGLPAERIAAAIAFVEGLSFGDEWQEYRQQAEDAKGEALVQLRQLHADAVEAARLKAENERLQAELAAARAATITTPTGDVVDTATGEVLDGGSVSSPAAADPIVPDEPDAAPAATVEEMGGEAPDAGMALQDEGFTEGQGAQQVLKAEPATADATDRAIPADASPRVGAMGAGQPADAGPAVDRAVPAPEPAQCITFAEPEPPTVEAELQALAAEARASRFPSQPKMSLEWWARFYALADRGVA